MPPTSSELYQGNIRLQAFVNLQRHVLEEKYLAWLRKTILLTQRCQNGHPISQSATDYFVQVFRSLNQPRNMQLPILGGAVSEWSR